jgi:pheromone shutdown protein TraB
MESRSASDSNVEAFEPALEVVTLPVSGHEIILVPKSAGDLARKVIEDEQPHAVMLELDPRRVAQLFGNQVVVWVKPRLNNSKDDSGAGSTKKDVEQRSGLGGVTASGLSVVVWLAFTELWRREYIAGISGGGGEVVYYHSNVELAVGAANAAGIPVMPGDRDYTITASRIGAHMGGSVALRRALLSVLGVPICMDHRNIDFTPRWSPILKLYWNAWIGDFKTVAAVMEALEEEAKTAPSQQKINAAFPLSRELSDETGRIFRKALVEEKLEPEEAATFTQNIRKLCTLANKLLTPNALLDERDIVLSHNAWALAQTIAQTRKEGEEARLELWSTGPELDSMKKRVRRKLAAAAGSTEDGKPTTTRVVAVVGAGHVKGVARYLTAFDEGSMTFEKDVAPLLQYPPRTLLDSPLMPWGVGLVAATLPFTKKKIPSKMIRYGPLGALASLSFMAVQASSVVTEVHDRVYTALSNSIRRIDREKLLLELTEERKKEEREEAMKMRKWKQRDGE